jgi:glutamyl-tRNA(Gln) amidotransferase subunit E
MDFESILNLLKFKKRTKEEITAPIKFLKEKYKEIGKKLTEEATVNWVMGELHNQAIGNMDLKELYEIVKTA